ncbi:DUF4381 domain-containing protein [Pseudomonas sp. TMW 2.1634]|uniref:DUF4381 domain-containing protein n=1 Tax=Pseudomonas TaxID=286 RepID=UPI000E76A500|nr:DUF4381 domain-containing protein [Pseudomonas sp. TMW 2.1634]AOA05530.1 alpha-2 type XI collagen [Pseudomonas sp. TMW 2.1634]
MTSPIPSIDQLQTLALPAPVSYLPQTWGWWALLGLVLSGLAVWAARACLHWRRDRYRREALQRLAQLRTANDPLGTLRELPTLLKRVALSMPVPQAAGPLQGEAWQDFLSRHGPQPVPEDFSQQLAFLAYAPDEQLLALPATQRQQLVDTCTRWVELHHVAV